MESSRGRTITGLFGSSKVILAAVFGALVPAVLATPAGETGVATLAIAIEASGRAASSHLTVHVHSRDGLTKRTTLAPGTYSAVLELDGKPPWRVRAEGDGLWGEEKVCLAPSSTQLRLRLWEASRLVGRLIPPNDSEAPDHIWIELRQAVEDEPGQSGLLLDRCSVELEKPFSCAVPAGRWHIRLSVPGMVPHELPGAVLHGGLPLDLGQIKLVRGVQVSGRAEGLRDEEQRAAVRVRLLPGGDSTTLSEADKVLRRRFARETSVDDSGGFRFEGVAAGAYWLTAELPSCPPRTIRLLVSGEAPHVEVADPLILDCGARLIVTVEPPEAILEDGLALCVLGEHPLIGYEAVAEGTLFPGSKWESPPLAPGRYRIELRDRDAEQGVVAARSVMLGTTDMDIEFSLDRVAITGRLLLGREPVAGVIQLSQDDSDALLETTADEEGRFSLILPRAGRWSATVELARPRQVSRVADIEVSPGRELEIRLPSGRVTGRTVTVQGTPVAGAGVQLFTEDRRPGPSTLSGPDGHFVLRGIAGGTYSITATSGERVGRKHSLTLADGGEAVVVMVVEDGVELRCRVGSTAGPVPQANVLAYPLSSAGALTSQTLPSAVTNAEGIATFSLPPDSVAARLLVMAHGFALRATDLTPVPARDEGLEVLLTRQAGTLVLASGVVLGADTIELLLVDDVAVDVSMLASWAYLNGVTPAEPGSVLEVPMMPPGRYQLCRLGYSEALMVLGGLARPKPAACVAGHLGPGGTLVLGFPERSAQPQDRP